MYIVVTDFYDLQDANWHYAVGDVFPRDGFGVTPTRLAELSGRDNLRGLPLIKEKDEQKPKRKRGAKNGTT